MEIIDIMISIMMLSSTEIVLEMAARLKKRRLAQNLTQEGLVRRSGVPLGTLKKFERSGRISLRSFLQLAIALKDERALQNLLLEPEFKTLDDVLQSDKPAKRGRIN